MHTVPITNNAPAHRLSGWPICPRTGQMLHWTRCCSQTARPAVSTEGGDRCRVCLSSGSWHGQAQSSPPATGECRTGCSVPHTAPRSRHAGCLPPPHLQIRADKGGGKAVDVGHVSAPHLCALGAGPRKLAAHQPAAREVAALLGGRGPERCVWELLRTSCRGDSSSSVKHSSLSPTAATCASSCNDGREWHHHAPAWTRRSAPCRASPCCCRAEG